MRFTPLYVLALVLALPACDSTTEPEEENRARAPDDVASATAKSPKYTYEPPFDLPPAERQPTFWTCAAQAEGRFVDAAVQILVLETRAFMETDPTRQAQLLEEVARRKGEAKSALHFALTVCVDTYGPPVLFALPDESGNLVVMPFTVSVYYKYLVNKHLEKT
jgi:hypothetical protein